MKERYSDHPHALLGALVTSKEETKYCGKLGFVVRVVAESDHNLWPGVNLIEVLYPCTGEEILWADEALEVLNESR